jgi:hypothetical protein
MARERNRGWRGEEGELTSRPGAYLAGMAEQCPRGRPGAAEGRLCRGTTGSTAIDASTGVHTLLEVSLMKHSRHQGRSRRGVEIGGGCDAKIPSGIPPWISSERRWSTEWFGGD